MHAKSADFCYDMQPDWVVSTKAREESHGFKWLCSCCTAALGAMSWRTMLPIVVSKSRWRQQKRQWDRVKKEQEISAISPRLLFIPPNLDCLTSIHCMPASMHHSHDKQTDKVWLRPAQLCPPLLASHMLKMYCLIHNHPHRQKHGHAGVMIFLRCKVTWSHYTAN